MSRKIIIDTDPGIDDAMAILFAFQSPEVEVVGLTTVFGNVRTDLATQNALRLVELAGLSNVPVAHGASQPLSMPFEAPADYVHGTDGFGNIFLPPPASRAVDQSAAQFMVDTIMAQPGEVTLVPIGPLTNLALALALEPRIVHHVREVVLMGGAATVNGNVTPAAEANIIHDPQAADIVFTAGWPVTMVGLDVTMQILMSDEYLLEIKEAGTRMTDFIYDISRFYRQYHHQTYQLNGLHTHDPAAIAYVIDPGLFAVERGPVRVLTEGPAIGQTLWDRRNHWSAPNAWTSQPAANVCLTVDSQRLLQLYKARMTQPCC